MTGKKIKSLLLSILFSFVIIAGGEELDVGGPHTVDPIQPIISIDEDK